MTAVGATTMVKDAMTAVDVRNPQSPGTRATTVHPNNHQHRSRADGTTADRPLEAHLVDGTSNQTGTTVCTCLTLFVMHAIALDM
jgi:hypothetical protein